MKKLTAIVVMGLLIASIAPILGETCSTDEQNTTCPSNTTSAVSKFVAKSFLNNLRNGTMDFNGNKLVHTILTQTGDVKLTSPLLQKNFGEYEFTTERDTPGWYSYDVQSLTKPQKQYEPMVPKIYTENTSDEE
jgi:hypothetical protein